MGKKRWCGQKVGKTKDGAGKKRAEKRIRNNHPPLLPSTPTQPSTIKSAPSTCDRIICRPPPPSATVSDVRSAAVFCHPPLSAAARRHLPYVRRCQPQSAAVFFRPPPSAAVRRTSAAVHRCLPQSAAVFCCLPPSAVHLPYIRRCPPQSAAVICRPPPSSIRLPLSAKVCCSYLPSAAVRRTSAAVLTVCCSYLPAAAVRRHSPYVRRCPPQSAAVFCRPPLSATVPC